MGRMQKGRVADLARALQRATTSLNATLALLDEPASAAAETGDWNAVKKAAEQVSKQATTVGVLWTGAPKVEESGEAMRVYVDSLQGFLLICHGCTVGAGPTLLFTVRKAAKNVLDASLCLLNRAVSFSVKGSEREEREAALPALVGRVWEACTAIRRIPSTNRAAIGRSVAQVATSVKDVLREIGEMNQGNASDHHGCCCGGHHHGEDVTDESGENGDKKHNGHGTGDTNTSVESIDYNEEFLPEEMEIVISSKGVVGSLLEFIKQLLYVAAETPSASVVQVSESASTLSLENVLKHCQGLGLEVDELGASLYPPQEMTQIRERVGKTKALVELITREVSASRGSLPDGLQSACENLQNAQIEFTQTLGGLRSTQTQLAQTLGGLEIAEV